jgi:RNA polymerase sigma factor (sigma-70 family)
MTESENKKRIIGELFTSQHAALHTFIMVRIQNSDEADDLISAAFERLLNRADMLCEATAKSLLYTVVQNLLIDYYRKASVKRQYKDFQMKMYDETFEAEHVYAVHDILEKERDYVQSLPEKRRNVYLLSRYEDMSQHEIAQKLQMNPRTVEKHLEMGRREVRNYLRAVCF